MFPIGIPTSWEEARQLNSKIHQTNRQSIRAKVAAVRDDRVWSLDSQANPLFADWLLSTILGYTFIHHSVPYGPVEIRSLNEMTWSAVGVKPPVIIALSVVVWDNLTHLPDRAIVLCMNCETLQAARTVTGVRAIDPMIWRPQERIIAEGGSISGSLQMRTIQMDNEVRVFGSLAEEACNWQK